MFVATGIVCFWPVQISVPRSCFEACGRWRCCVLPTMATENGGLWVLFVQMQFIEALMVVLNAA